MKITNKYLAYFALLLSIILVVSCEDEDKDFIGNSITKSAPFARFDETPIPIVGVDDVNDVSFSFRVLDANNNIASYDLRIAANLGGTQTDTVALASFTNFPADISFSSSDLFTPLGLTAADVTFGDTFFFVASVTGDDGNTYDQNVALGFDDLDDDDPQTYELTGDFIDELRNEAGYRQAYLFQFTIACPAFPIDDVVGTYNVASNGLATALGLTDPDPTREVIAGPGDNQITIVGGSVGFAGGGDLTVDIDPSFGGLTGGEGLAFPASIIGFASDFGDLAGAGGLAVPCVTPKTITLPITLTCCGGTFTMVLSQ
ncbi:hypothetical protein [Aquimarina mytili]|uniref:DUF4331 domain-containing protein n=1 Tax=Aquimarina mytili TaxID=874423 RepID=A0A937A1G6_9FLAO|nr:hypothetical protein [Aquimarina mytili]MBL0685126.1 hypothetical protein [Aquimarina mytili]